MRSGNPHWILTISSQSDPRSRPRLRYGPDRALFLPGGLLAPEDVPEYLNGEFAGEYVPFSNRETSVQVPC